MRGKDITGVKCGRLTPLYPTNERCSKSIVWLCQCDCGKKIKVRADKLNPKSPYSTKSCGCLLGSQLKVGQKFGKLTIISAQTKSSNSQNKLWKCLCDCGKEVYVTSNALTSGRTKSCGCLVSEQMKILGGYNKKNLIGQKFGKLEVVEEMPQRSPYGDVLWKCKCDCGNTTVASTSSLTKLHKHSCGCSNSKGNAKIYSILTELNLNFETEKSFDDCYLSSKNRLRFDFYLPDYNTCIEYDGIQHFVVSDYGWNTKERFQKTQKSDNKKNQYCENKNIRLIRIPYYDFNKLDKKYILDRLEKDE